MYLVQSVLKNDLVYVESDAKLHFTITVSKRIGFYERH